VIRNIIFDMGDVLLWYRPLQACLALLENAADAQALYAAFFGGDAWVAVDHGTLDGDAFTTAVKAQLPTRLHPAVDMLYAGMPENILIPIEGMDAVVDAVLRRGFNVYLLSNAGKFMSRRRDVIPHIGRFHGVMFSGDEGMVKPDPRLYERLMARYGLQAEECLFIEDRENNLLAAAALGWRTHRFTGDIQALQSELNAL